MFYRSVNPSVVNTLIDFCDANDIGWDIYDDAENVEFGVDNEDDWEKLKDYL